MKNEYNIFYIHFLLSTYSTPNNCYASKSVNIAKFSDAKILKFRPQERITSQDQVDWHHEQAHNFVDRAQSNLHHEHEQQACASCCPCDAMYFLCFCQSRYATAATQ